MVSFTQDMRTAVKAGGYVGILTGLFLELQYLYTNKNELMVAYRKKNRATEEIIKIIGRATTFSIRTALQIAIRISIFRYLGTSLFSHSVDWKLLRTDFTTAAIANAVADNLNPLLHLIIQSDVQLRKIELFNYMLSIEYIKMMVTSTLLTSTGLYAYHMDQAHPK